MDTEPGGSGIDDYTRKVAGILRREYENSGLSYNELAATTGISRITILRIMNARRPISAWYLHVLCDALGIRPGDVLNEADES